jgi:hypothetical protein
MLDVRKARADEAPLVVSILREAAVWLERRGVPLWSEVELEQTAISRDVGAGHYVLAFSGELAVGTARLTLEDALYERFGFEFHSELTVGPYFVARYQKATAVWLESRGYLPRR